MGGGGGIILLSGIGLVGDLKQDREGGNIPRHTLWSERHQKTRGHFERTCDVVFQT